MRFLSFAIFSLFISTQAMAAMTASDWQSQLQDQLRQLEAQSDSVRANGEVAVQENGAVLRATLPALTVTSPDRSYWTIPSIILQANASSEALAVKLPETITRYNAGKKEIAKLTLGVQTINGRWNDSGQFFEGLNGSIKTIAFNDTIANAQTTIANVSIAANKGSPVQLNATDIRSVTVQNQNKISTAMAKAMVSYQMPSADKMTLARLIGYFNPSILLGENKEVVFTVTAEQLNTKASDSRMTSLQKFVSKFDLKPNGENVSGNISSQTYIVSQTPPSPYSVVLPRQSDLTASFTNLPKQLISFAPGLSSKMAKTAMDNAGTAVNISKLTITTFDQGKLTGSGNLKADNSTPSGFTGRITLNIDNLKDIISANQMQLLQPDNGTDRAAKTQGLMAMMMLQGLGKQNGNATQFVVDLTADGQTLVNGQDLSGLTGGKSKSKVIETTPSVPVTPVQSSNL